MIFVIHKRINTAMGFVEWKGARIILLSQYGDRLKSINFLATTITNILGRLIIIE
jgi:hypothetical protein